MRKLIWKTSCFPLWFAYKLCYQFSMSKLNESQWKDKRFSISSFACFCSFQTHMNECWKTDSAQISAKLLFFFSSQSCDKSINISLDAFLFLSLIRTNAEWMKQLKLLFDIVDVCTRSPSQRYGIVVCVYPYLTIAYPTHM